MRRRSWDYMAQQDGTWLSSRIGTHTKAITVEVIRNQERRNAVGSESSPVSKPAPYSDVLCCCCCCYAIVLLLHLSSSQTAEAVELLHKNDAAIYRIKLTYYYELIRNFLKLNLNNNNRLNFNFCWTRCSYSYSYCRRLASLFTNVFCVDKAATATGSNFKIYALNALRTSLER